MGDTEIKEGFIKGPTKFLGLTIYNKDGSSELVEPCKEVRKSIEDNLNTGTGYISNGDGTFKKK